jgi:class 3 adenylate cyclase/tetratricopeptide (TPR) repeat protein
MRCPNCQTENRDGRRFCAQCGVLILPKCAACGFANEPGEKFCGGCGAPLGRAAPDVSPAPPSASATSHLRVPSSYTPRHLAEKILTSKAALEGERKQVTVLFADLKGSMELLADRDPEDARKILDPVLEHMMEAVHRYEGTVNQVMGDGIMALFGAPVAHEDHAVRACYAALRMQESIKRYSEGVRRVEGIPIRIRVGLNSGEVVVRAIGSDLHMDYTAVGQTTHLAARMEQIADPGTVLVTPATLALAEGFVEVKALGPTPVKGLSEPIDVYELTGASAVRSRLQAAAARGLTKFVGRSMEVAQLQEALDAARSGKGQVVAVVGEPGVGKSRLFWEFTHSHRTAGCLIVEAASVSYGKATAYFPVIELLRAYFAIEPRDDTRKIREKVTGKALSLDRALEPSLPALLALLDVPVEDEQWGRLDPPQRRQRTLDGVKRLLLRESQVQPLIVVVEDLHWIDGETQALLDLLIESLPTAHILLLVNYRPEYQHGWGGKTYYRQSRIDPLPPASADELLDALLGQDAATGPLKRLLVERAEGNPFFLEESVRALLETGVLAGERGAYRVVKEVTDLHVPTTAQAILAARIDRLDPEDKRRLQAAAVVGKDVPFVLLHAISDESDDDLRAGIARLQAAEFLYETRLFPEVEYTFKHALTHEVAYASLLHERRRALHAQIVEAIESLYRDRLPEQIECLAHHAVRGELGERAVAYLRQAGQKAASRAALNEARRSFEQALGVLESLPERRETLEQAFDIRLELRPVLTMLGDAGRVLERLREAEALAQRLEDDERRGRAWAYMAAAHILIGDADAALASCERALESAGRLGDLRLHILASSFRAQLSFYRGDYESAVELARENLAALPPEWPGESFGIAVTPPVWERYWLVFSLGTLGRFAEAAGPEAEMMRLAEAMLNPFAIAMALMVAGYLRFAHGDCAAAHTFLERATSMARAAHMGALLPMAVAFLAGVLSETGEAAEALDRLREGEALWKRASARRVLGVGAGAGLLQWLAGGHFALGRRDDARRLAEAGVESAHAALGVKAGLICLLGDVAIHGDEFDAEESVTRYTEALALAEPRHMRPLIARCHAGLAKVYRRSGKPDLEREHFATATTMYREMGMTYWLERLETELKALP